MTPSAACGVRYEFFQKGTSPVTKRLKKNFIICLNLYGNDIYFQIKERKATGKCEGEHNWDCVCKSAPKDKDNEVE